MKLICTTSKVSWFTVGHEYNSDQGWVCDNDGDEWEVGLYGEGYRTGFLEDAEFSIAQDYEPVTAADDGPYSEEELQQEHEELLAAVVQMADEEGVREWFDTHLRNLRTKYDIAEAYEGSQRALLLALAYFAEEKSQ